MSIGKKLNFGKNLMNENVSIFASMSNIKRKSDS